MATVDLGKIKQVFRGTYDNSATYAPDDLVAFTDGSVTSTYICTTATTGNAPSSGGTAHANWAYVAKGQASSPTTTQGDIIVRGASADGRLAIGAAGKVLKVNSSANGLEYGEGGVWTKIASGTGPSVAATSVTIDNIFSDTYDFYKIMFMWAQDDWVLVRYIAADGTVRSGSNYSWVGGQAKHNSDVFNRYNDRSDTHAVYNYWDGQDTAWMITETLFADPYSSSKRTTESYTAMVPNGSQTTVAQFGANQYQSAESHRGVQIFGNAGDSMADTNFRYIVLGLKTS